MFNLCTEHGWKRARATRVCTTAVAVQVYISQVHEPEWCVPKKIKATCGAMQQGFAYIDERKKLSDFEINWTDDIYRVKVHYVHGIIAKNCEYKAI